MQHHRQTFVFAMFMTAAACGPANNDDNSANSGNNPDCEVLIDSAIGEDTTWTADPCPVYTVAFGVEVQAALTIEPGVTVRFQEAAGLSVVGTSASLSAVGTADDRITFTSVTEEPGHWEAVVINSDASANEIAFADFQYGGRGASFGFSGNQEANVIVAQEGAASITDSSFDDAQTYGLFVRSGGELREFSNNTFSNNGGAPLILTTNAVGYLDGSNTFAGENGDEHIRVEASTITREQTWPATDVPLRILDTSPIEFDDASQTLTVSAGTVIEFGANGGLKAVDGALAMIGTESEPITIRGTEATPGHWQALVFDSNNPANELTYVAVSDGGSGSSFGFSGNTPACVVVGLDGQLNITNSTFTGCADYGVFVGNNAQLSGFETNQFVDNGSSSLSIPARQVVRLDEDSDYGTNFVAVRTTDIDEPGVWPRTNAPLRFETYTNIELSNAADEITVAPGATIEFGESAGIRVNSGALSAVGDGDNIITFRGAVETSGYWEALVFASNNPANELAFTSIAHGGAGNSFGFSGNTEALVVAAQDGIVSISDSTLSDSKDLCFAGAGVTTSNVTTSGCN